MKSLFMASVLAMGLSISAFAAETTPLGTRGHEPDPKYEGVSTCEIAFSTGTSALLCATGEGIILDIVASSVAVTDTIVFRDSATANTSSTVLYSIDKNSLDKANRVFPRFKNGLSANALVSPTASLAASRPNWTIVYTTKLK